MDRETDQPAIGGASVDDVTNVQQRRRSYRAVLVDDLNHSSLFCNQRSAIGQKFSFDRRIKPGKNLIRNEFATQRNIWHGRTVDQFRDFNKAQRPVVNPDIINSTFEKVVHATNRYFA